MSFVVCRELEKYGQISRYLDRQAGFFAFAETENQIDDETDKGHRGDNPPQSFFAHGAEVFLGDVDNGPDGAQEKWHT